ncbi:ABC transporter permease subunit [Xenophilus arseniciresistens]|uniref:Glutamate/aspartate import permease protein GltK n=1 Tax=Xenophilus arseniciresistens TaxID=1283306 RepID=A0AAE3SZE5_9BURK|nr:ABC transporter permease subunit [Xenophilus arseniciresistens]MDA7417092.1 ABC transporter permease subunit [Xenophilus arseniciresistens]
MEYDFNAIVRATPFLLEGMATTFKLTALAGVLGMLWGTVLAVMRFAPSRALSLFAAAYVNGIRAVPLIMVIFWIYFLLPLLTGRQIGAFNSALVAFVVFEGAYFSEIIRAGIQSVLRGQLQAAMAMGMGYTQAMRLVVLPQALRKMVPVLLTQGIALFQDTSLVYVVGLMDLLTAASTVATRDGRLVELYTFVALVYLVLCLAAAGAVELLRRRFNPA